MDIKLIQDTREKVGKHKEIEEYCKKNEIKVLRSKLPFGDYVKLGDWNITIDFKQSAIELFNCLTKDHIRFRNEIKGANEFGIGIVILIEEKDFYATLDTFGDWYRIPLWKNDGWKTVYGKKHKTHSKGDPMCQVNVNAIVKSMKTMQEKYAVLFKFTTKERCGADIINILHNRYEEYNNYFQNKLKEIRSNTNGE